MRIILDHSKWAEMDKVWDFREKQLYREHTNLLIMW